MPGDLTEADSVLAHHRQHVGLYVPPCVFVLVSNLRGNHDDPIKWTRPRILLKAPPEQNSSGLNAHTVRQNCGFNFGHGSPPVRQLCCGNPVFAWAIRSTWRLSGMRCHWKQCGHSSRSISPSSDTWDELPSHPRALSPAGEIVTRSCVTVMRPQPAPGCPVLCIASTRVCHR